MENLIEVYSDSEDQNIDLKQIIQVLKDIKSLKDAHPEVSIAVKNNYNEIKISNKSQRFEIEFMYKENSWTLTSHNLPDRINLLKIGKPISLKRAVENCKIAIENLEEFFEVIDVIDRNIEVVQPRIKSTKDNWRIVKFNKNVYIKIELPNPLNVKDVLVTFYGKSEHVEKIQELYNNQDHEDENVYWRLHSLRYEIDDSGHSQQENDKIDCGICFEYYDESDECPLVFCENSTCPQAFHSSCLSRHLKVSNLKILNVAIGECPYCKFKIQINIKENK